MTEDLQSVLYDFDATIKAKPQLSEAELLDLFPEFGNDANKLKAAFDYSATLSSGKYKSPEEFNAKFPEFFPVKGWAPGMEMRSIPKEPAKLGGLQVNPVGVPEVGLTPQSVLGVKGSEGGANNYADIANQVIESNPRAVLERSINIAGDEVKQAQEEIYSNAPKADFVPGRRIVPGSSLKAQVITDTNQRAELEKLELAEKLMGGARKTLEAPKAGDWGFFKGAGESFRSEKLWSVGMSEMMKSSQIKEVADKLDAKQTLTRGDQAVLDALAMQTQAELERKYDTSASYKGGKGAVEMAAFIAELSATGGIGKLALKGAERALLGAIAERIGGKVLKSAATFGAKALTRTGMAGIGASFAPSTITGTTDLMTGTATPTIQEGKTKFAGFQDRKSGVKAYADAMSDTWIEFGTEMSGGSLGLAGKALKEIPGLQAALHQLSQTGIGKVAHVLGNNPVLKQAGVHNFLGEYNEEFDGALIRQIFKDESMKESFFNKDAQATLLFTLAPMGGFSAAMNGVAFAKVERDYNKSNKAFDERLFDNGYSQEEAAWIKEEIRNTPAQQLPDLLLAITTRRNIDSAAFFVADGLAYAFDSAKKAGYTEGLRTKVADKQAEKEAEIQSQTNKDTGEIQIVRLMTGEEVPLTAGRLSLNEEGKIVFMDSPDTYFYRDSEGKIKPLHKDAIESLVSSVSAAEFIQKEKERIAKSELGKANYQAGQSVILMQNGEPQRNENGEVMKTTIQRVDDNGVYILADGVEVVMSFDEADTMLGLAQDVMPDLVGQNFVYEGDNVEVIGINEDGTYEVDTYNQDGTYMGKTKLTAEQLVEGKDPFQAEQESIMSAQTAQNEVSTPTDTDNMVEIPKNKKGEVDYENIQDPAIYNEGLKQEFGKESPAILDELIKEAKDDLKKAQEKTNAIERKRAVKQAQERLNMLETVKSLQAPETAPAIEQTAPVEAETARVTGEKQLWEMTFDEFSELTSNEDVFGWNESREGIQTDNLLNEVESLTEELNNAPAKQKAAIETKIAKLNKKIASIENDWVDSHSHENIIRQAISEGKKIPAEVLAEYPDIKKETKALSESQIKKVVSFINQHDWWRTAVNEEAINERGLFLASSYEEAEFYGRPLDDPFKVSISNPFIGTGEMISKQFGVNWEANDAEEQFEIDRQIKEAATKQGYDAVVLVTNKGYSDILNNAIPESMELNVFNFDTKEQEITDRLNSIRLLMPNSPEAIILPDINSMLEKLKELGLKGAALNNFKARIEKSNIIPGLQYKGKIIFNLAAIYNVEDAVITYIHESVHIAVKGLISKQDLAAIGGVAEKYAEFFPDYSLYKNDSVEVLGEEVLAFAVETMVKLNGAESVLNAELQLKENELTSPLLEVLNKITDGKYQNQIRNRADSSLQGADTRSSEEVQGGVGKGTANDGRTEVRPVEQDRSGKIKSSRPQWMINRLISVGEPKNMRELIMHKLILGQKLRWNDIKSDTGEIITRGLGGEYRYNESERKLRSNSLTGYIHKDNGLTPEQFAHQLWEANSFEDGQYEDIPLFGYDTQDYLNEILDIVNSYNTATFILNALENTNKGFVKNENDYYDKMMELEFEEEGLQMADVFEIFPENIPAEIVDNSLKEANFTPEELNSLYEFLNTVYENSQQTSVEGDVYNTETRSNNQQDTKSTAGRDGTSTDTANQRGDSGSGKTTESVEQKKGNLRGKDRQDNSREKFFTEKEYVNNYISEYSAKNNINLDEFEESEGYYDVFNKAVDSYPDYINELKQSGKLQEYFDNANIGEKIAIRRGIESAGFDVHDIIDLEKDKQKAKQEREQQKREKQLSIMRKISEDFPLQNEKKIATFELDQQIAEQSHNDNQTEKQKKSGIYDKARINLQGFNITIETRKGQQRTGVDSNGKAWSITMNNHYGELDGTKGYDGDAIDVFIGENPQGQIFVVDQINPDTGEFDESKVMLGFDSAEQAREAYMSNYEEGWQGFGSITPAGENFKQWLYDGLKQRKPFAEYKDTPNPVETNNTPASIKTKLLSEINLPKYVFDFYNSLKQSSVSDYTFSVYGKGFVPFNANRINDFFANVYRAFNDDKQIDKDILNKNGFDLSLVEWAESDRIKFKNGIFISKTTGEFKSNQNHFFAGTQVNISETKEYNDLITTEKAETKQPSINPELSKQATDKINKLNEEKKQIKTDKNRLVKQMADRNGLFGDTKADPNDLFGGESMIDIQEGNKKLAEYTARTREIDRQIELIKQSDLTAQKENAGQQEIKEAPVQSTEEVKQEKPQEKQPETPSTTLQKGDKVKFTLAGRTSTLPESEFKQLPKGQVVFDYFGLKTLEPGQYTIIRNGEEISTAKKEEAEQKPESTLSRKNTIVLDQGNGIVINDLWIEWNKIKDENQQAQWVENVKNAKFGTYGTMPFFDVLNKFEPKYPSEILKKQFITELESALDITSEKRSYQVKINANDFFKTEQKQEVQPQAEKPVEASEQPETVVFPKDKVYDAYKALHLSPSNTVKVEEGMLESDAKELLAELDKYTSLSQEEKAKAVEKYKADYIKARSSVWAVAKNAYSSAVAGRNNFNLKQAEQRGSALDKAEEAFTKWRKNAIQEFEDKTGITESKKAEAQKNAETKAEKAQKVKVATVKYWMNLKSGDTIPIGNGRSEIVKKNALSIETAGGSKWTLKEITGIDHKEAQQIMDELKESQTPVEAKPETTSPKQPESLLAKHSAFKKSLNEGNLSIDEFKQSFNDLLQNKEAIKAELSKKTKDELLKILSPSSAYMYKTEKKDRVVDAVYSDMLDDFYLSDTMTVVWGETSEQVTKRAVEKYEQKDLDDYAEKVKQYQQKAKERAQKALKTLTNPETLEEYREFIRIKGYQALSPEQRAAYDLLDTDRIKAAKEAKKEEKVQKVGDIFAKGQFNNTKTGELMHVVSMTERVSNDEYQRLVKIAKTNGGYFSSFNKGGAIAGFLFKTEQQANDFLAEVMPDESKEEVQQTKEVNPVVARLRESANKVIEAAENELNRDRLTNTAKRAREAGYAEENARESKRNGQTMLNIADAIERGDVKLLDGIKSKTHIDLLDKLLRIARYAEMRDKNLSYSERQAFENTPITAESVEYLKSGLYPKLYGANLLEVINKAAETKGLKQVAAKWLKRGIKSNDDFQVRNESEMNEVIDMFNALSEQERKYHRFTDEIADYKRLRAMGIDSDTMFRAALREYATFRGEKQEADRVKELERAIVGRNVGFDFFPTPANVADRMVEIAGVNEGMEVLEPSAGNGNIADAINRSGVTPEVIELSTDLRAILEAKGYPVVGSDFEDFTGKKYDRIIMNPPFSNGLDGDHVQHAYELLKPNGRLVAIVGEGTFNRSDKKATAFREWLDEVGADVEKLPEGTFNDRTLLNTTGANARMVTIDKEEPNLRQLPEENPFTDITLKPIENDYDLSEDTQADFEYDLMQALGRKLSGGRYDYTRKGDVIIRVKDHTPNWDNFINDVEENGVKAILNITVGDYNNTDYRRNKSSKEQFESGYPEIKIIDIEVEDGQSLSSVINTIQTSLTEDSEPNLRQLPETITINGVEKPTTNSEGKPIHSTEEGVRNFYEWFSNSKVVDKQGRPLVVYHGAYENFDIFKKSELGKYTNAESAKQGFFFTDKKDLASDFAYDSARSFGKYSEKQILAQIQKADFEKINEFVTRKIKGEYDFSIYNSINEYLEDNRKIKSIEPSESEYRDAINNLAAEYLYNGISDSDTSNEYKRIFDELGIIIGYVQEVELKIENPLVVNKAIDFEDGDGLTHYIEKAKKDGNDGVIFNNVREVILEGSKMTKQFVVFEPTQIKSATGNSGEFSADTDDIRFRQLPVRPSLDDYQGNIPEYLKAMKEYSEKASELVPELHAEAHKALSGGINEARRKYQDADLPIDNLQKFIKEQGGVVTDSEDAYNDKNRSAGRATFRSQQFEKNQMQTLVDVYKEIIDTNKLESLPEVPFDKEVTTENIRKIGAYLQAKDIQEAIELGIVGRGEVGFFKATGVTHSDYIKQFESLISPDLVLKLWDAVNNATLFAINAEYEAGIISPESRKEFTSRRYYVPQRGWDERDTKEEETYYVKTGHVYGDAYNALAIKAKGRNSLASDPLKYIQSMAHSAILTSEKNLYKKKALELVKDNIHLGRQAGMFDFKRTWYINIGKGESGEIEYEEVFKRPDQSLFDHDKQVYQDIKDLRKLTREKKAEAKEALKLAVESNDKVMIQVWEDEIKKIDKETSEKTIELIESIKVKTKVHDDYAKRRTSDEKRQHEVVVYDRGERYVITFNDERVSNSLNNKHDRIELHPVLQAIRPATRFYSALLTQYNPAFALWNFARDFQLANYVLLNEQGAKFTAEFDKNILNLSLTKGALYRHMAGKEDYNNGTDLLLRDFFADGSATGFTYLKDLDQLQKDLKKAIEPSMLQTTLGNSLNLLNGKAMGKAFGALTEMSEVLTRFAAYKTAIEQGKTREQAATIAKDITVNFNRSGSNTGVWTSLFSFFNASVQGSYRGLSTIKYGSRFAGAVALLATLGFVNALFNPDDPEEEKAWSEYDYMQNVIIFGVKLPLAHFFRGFWAFGAQMALAYQGKKSIGNALFDSIKFMSNEVIPQTVNPLNLLKWDKESSSVAYDGLRDYVPSVAQPIFDVAENKTFTGASVYRTPLTDKDKIPQAFLGKRDVSPAAQWISNTLLEAGGGDLNIKDLNKPDGDKVAPVFDVNPSVIEYLTTSYTGGVGKFFMDTYKTIDDVARTGSVEPSQVPVLNRMVKPYNEEKIFYGKYAELTRKVKAYEYSVKQRKNTFVVDGEVYNPSVYDYITLMSSPKGVIVIKAKGLQKGIEELQDNIDILRANNKDKEADELNKKLTSKVKEVGQLLDEWNKIKE